ncbi:hypothetical protein [Streptomyces sp. NPDC047981]|uniref:hypothetical protein n=1 Tax=Streptomyces sp. NPDC047981 TaxID=3154610 RepID=UPI00343D4796
MVVVTAFGFLLHRGDDCVVPSALSEIAGVAGIGIASEPSSRRRASTEPLRTARPAPTAKGRKRDEQLLAAVRDATERITLVDLTVVIGTQAAVLLVKIRPRLGLERGTPTQVLTYIKEHKERLAQELCGRPLETLRVAEGPPRFLAPADKQLIGAILRQRQDMGISELAAAYGQKRQRIEYGLRELGRRLGVHARPARLIPYVHANTSVILEQAGLSGLDTAQLPDLPVAETEALTTLDRQLIGAILRHPRDGSLSGLARAYGYKRHRIQYGVEGLTWRLGLSVRPVGLVPYIHAQRSAILERAGLSGLDNDQLPDLVPAHEDVRGRHAP